MEPRRRLLAILAAAPFLVAFPASLAALPAPTSTDDTGEVSASAQKDGAPGLPAVSGSVSPAQDPRIPEVYVQLGGWRAPKVDWPGLGLPTGTWIGVTAAVAIDAQGRVLDVVVAEPRVYRFTDAGWSNDDDDPIPEEAAKDFRAVLAGMFRATTYRIAMPEMVPGLGPYRGTIEMRWEMPVEPLQLFYVPARTLTRDVQLYPAHWPPDEGFMRRIKVVDPDMPRDIDPSMTQPRLLSRTAKSPPFSRSELKFLRKGGDVTFILEAVVSAQGVVTQVNIVRESRHLPALTERAIETLKQWKYAPAEDQGKPVPFYVTVRMDFSSN